jgi:4-hydroxy-tetrahydrodipicolinate reductase
VFDAKLPAVIAPQMGKQVVALQAAIKQMAESFPGAFKGYSMRVVESHQASKVDTSGTAKALIQSFNELGVGFDVNNVELIRDVETQRDVMNIPEEYLLGHAYHTYTLTSADNTVSFEFQHNVCGRTIYAEGTVDAVGFLSRNLERSDGKTLFDMIDVLREGGMVTDANTTK